MGHVRAAVCATIGGITLMVAVAMSAIGQPSAAAQRNFPAAEHRSPYTVEVSDVTAKVGQHAVMRATLRLREDCRIIEAYNNRVGQLSSFDDGVAFEQKMVRGAVQDGTLVFAIDVEPTKAGKHPINGVFRIGYIESENSMAMVSVPLIASVTGSD